jgi:hypothetical protein
MRGTKNGRVSQLAWPVTPACSTGSVPCPMLMPMLCCGSPAATGTIMARSRVLVGRSVMPRAGGLDGETSRCAAVRRRQTDARGSGRVCVGSAHLIGQKRPEIRRWASGNIASADQSIGWQIPLALRSTRLGHHEACSMQAADSISATRSRVSDDSTPEESACVCTAGLEAQRLMEKP